MWTRAQVKGTRFGGNKPLRGFVSGSWAESGELQAIELRVLTP